MKEFLTTSLRIILIFTFLFITEKESYSAGFALYAGSARGNALGAALIARADDPSAIFYNPAGITQLPGLQIAGGGTIIHPRNHVTTDFLGTREDAELISNWFFLPYGYLTYQKNDCLWFGVGIFPRFGLGTEFKDDWAGRYNSYNAFLKSFEINPNIAYKITDRFSVAGGFSLMRIDVKLQQKIPLVDVDSTLKGHSYGWGFNLGLRYEICDWMAMGITYRSKIKHNLDGRADFIKPDLLHKLFRDGPVHADLMLPDEYSMGVVFKPLNRVTVEFDAIFTRWRSFDHMTINFDDGIVGLDKITKYKNWHDVWRYQIGLEYALTRMLDLRVGYVYDNTPIPKSTVDYLVPMDDQQHFDCGFGVHWDCWSVDLSYTYIRIKDRNYDARPLDGVPKSRIHTGDAHLIAFGVGYKF
jgi:long-chain fatty acid transport protein